MSGWALKPRAGTPAHAAIRAGELKLVSAAEYAEAQVFFG